jgi:8-oxo-dGTP pyrophosphatase MutT (NUDIX family)
MANIFSFLLNLFQKQNGDQRSEIVAAILQRPDSKILLLKRSPNRHSDPEKWCFVTGYVKAGENLEKAVKREVLEELNLKIKPLKKGKTVFVNKEGKQLRVYPFLFKVQANVVIKIDKEHSEFTWIFPKDIRSYDIVQQVDDDLISLGLL